MNSNFHRRYELFSGFTSTSPSDESCFRWGEYRVRSLLPGDPPFNEKDNRYDIPSYKRICKEFNIPTDLDFRCHKGDNHGLGSVYIWVHRPRAVIRT